MNFLLKQRKPVPALLIANAALLLPYFLATLIGPFVSSMVWEFKSSMPFNMELFFYQAGIGIVLCIGGTLLVGLPAIYVAQKMGKTGFEPFTNILALFSLIVAIPVLTLRFWPQVKFGYDFTFLIVIFSIVLVTCALTAGMIYWYIAIRKDENPQALKTIRKFLVLWICMLAIYTLLGSD